MSVEANKEFRAFQRAFFQKLRDRPLDLSDEGDRALYQPLHDVVHDPVERLFDTIEMHVIRSVQLVTGFRGTGKTTEFSRLEKRLWETGYHVIRVDLDGYVDMGSPLDVRDFLLMLAFAITDQLTRANLLGPKHNLGGRLVDMVKPFLPTLREATVKVGFADLKLSFRTDETFRAMVREKAKGRLAELKRELHKHHEAVLKALRDKAGRDVRLVVILDSLEHMRGSIHDATEVRRSVEDLFFAHAHDIGLPDTHMVISVPAFLYLQADNLAAHFVNGEVKAWPAFRVADRKGNRTEVVDRLVALVEKRGDWSRILPDKPALEEIILASGGHLRDLLNMLVEALHLARHGVDANTARAAMDGVRRGYSQLFRDEVELLRKVAQEKHLAGLDSKERDRLLRFLDSGLVLCYLNRDFWYDVHPLVRDTVLAE